jgi:hypothetical protein
LIITLEVEFIKIHKINNPKKFLENIAERKKAFENIGKRCLFHLQTSYLYLSTVKTTIFLNKKG